MEVLPDEVLNRPVVAKEEAREFVVVRNALTDLVFSAVRMAAERLSATRSGFIGRKGGAVPFSRLMQEPVIPALYRHPQFVRMAQQAAGCREPLRTIPSSHQHACSLLVYEEAGDSITWHYDRNYYSGKTFTVLLTLENRDASRLLPSGNTTCVWEDGGEMCWATAPNSVVVMQGQHVLHKAKPLGEGERRVVLSMVYSTDPRQSPAQMARQRVKDWSWGF